MFSKNKSQFIFEPKVLHRITGVWPEYDQFLGRYYRVKGYIFLLVSAIFFILSMVDLYRCLVHDVEDDTLFESVSESTITTITVLKIIPAILNRHRILTMLKMMEEINESSNSMAKEKQKNHQWNNYQSLLTKLCLIVYTLLAFSYACIPLVTDERFPLAVQLPNVVYMNPWYTIVYAIQSFGLLLLLIACLSNDCFCITFICQLRGELEFVRHLLTKLKKKHPTSLPNAINRHIFALEFGKQVINSYELAFIAQHIIIFIFLCFSGITVLKIQNYLIVTQTLAIDILMIVTLFMFCYVGEIVIDSSLRIANAIQTHGFHYFLDNVNSLKSLNLMLCRAQNPLRLTVGWKRSINFEFFIDTVKKIVSGVIFLRAVIK